MHQRGARNARSYASRKRKIEPHSSSKVAEQPLLLENPTLPDPILSIVDRNKVTSYLQKLLPVRNVEKESCYVKMLMGNSEAQLVSNSFKERLISDYQIESIFLSDSSPFSIDRIITLHGKLENVLAAVVFLGYVLTAELNNLLKSQSYTLKSQNYKINILVEAKEFELALYLEKAGLIDFAPYNCNRNLNIVTLRGDLQHLMGEVQNLMTKFPFHFYKQDKDINVLPIIRLYDYDHLFKSPETHSQLQLSKEEILKFIFTQKYLDDLNGV